MSGAGTVLAFAFYIQSYLSILSILSIKNDCVALRFVADANWGAVSYARWFVLSGVLALLAIALPALVGIERNLRRWQKAYKLPPLQPGLEFDGWTEFQVRRVPTVQWFMVGISSVIFFALTFNLVYSAPGSKPEGVRHYFELQCSQPSDPGPFS